MHPGKLRQRHEHLSAVPHVVLPPGSSDGASAAPTEAHSRNAALTGAVTQASAWLCRIFWSLNLGSACDTDQ